MKYFGIHCNKIQLLLIILLLFTGEVHSAKAKLKQGV